MAVDAARAKSLFLAASDLANPAERAAYLERECGGDAELRGRVEALLQANDASPLPPAEMGDATVDSGPGEAPPQAAATSDYRPQIEPGLVIAGRYLLQQKIGEGGMGEVWVAKQTEPVKRKVALKLIKTGMDSKAVLARFEQERQALALMDHSNIARVLDGGMTPTGQPFFVMELVNGLPLTKFCDEARLTPQQRLELFVPICQAVQHAHQKGIVHRDLKPANILVTLIDARPVPKVIDFGVAKATVGKLTDESMSTQFGAVIGTFEYMAPEQAGFSGEDIDTRADIYSLGVILYELLTGLKPLDGMRLKKAALTEMIRIIREEEPPRPSTRLSTDVSLPSLAALRQTEPKKLMAMLSGELDWVVMKCLEKQRERRYETANSLARDVQRYLADEAVEARPPSAGYRLRKFVKRNRGMVTAASVVLLTVAFGIIGATWGWVDALDQRDKTEQARKNEAAAVKLAEKRRGEAEKVADENKSLATKEADRREQAEALALRVEFEHYFSKTEDRPDVALVGMTSLLPKAVRLKDQALADSLRLQIGAWNGRVARLNTIFAHPNGVITVAVSADGKIALTGSRDKTARLWETATGKPIGTPLEHQAEVIAVALSADGKTALTGSGDRAQVWETATGKPIGLPLQHDGGVYAVALSADGTMALTATAFAISRGPRGPLEAGARARLWATATGKPMGPPLEYGGWVVHAIALSADGKTALTSSFSSAQLWEAATGKRIGPALEHQGHVFALALSADGKTALTGCGGGEGNFDYVAQIWETATGKQIGPPLQHLGEVFAAALSADGKTALTGSGDKTARLWETSTGKQIGPPLLHRAEVRGVALSADAKTALTGSLDTTARLWKLPESKPFSPLGQQAAPVLAVALSADGKIGLTFSSNERGQLWETATGKPIGRPLQKYPQPPVGVGLSADGKLALVGSDNGWVDLTRTNDMTSGQWQAAEISKGPPLEPAPQFRHASYLRALALSADGKTLLTGGFDRTARLWDSVTGKPLRAPLQHQGEVGAAALSADGKIALTSSRDKTARLWETATGKPIGTPLEHQDVVGAVALSADGKTALTGSGDRARLWETATGTPIGPLLQHLAEVRAVALSADGKTALTGSQDKTARLWETATGKPIGPPLQHQAAVGTVTLSADGRIALTGSYDKTARIWHVPQPIRDDPERIMLWAQLSTGIEVDELTTVRVLDAATWHQRRERLEKLGGSPAP